MDPTLMGIPMVLLVWWGTYRIACRLGGWEDREEE